MWFVSGIVAWFHSSPPGESRTLQEHLYGLGADLVVAEDQLRSEAVQDQIKALGAAPRLAFNGVGGKSATNLARLLGY